MSDLDTRYHETWLGLVQPTQGLVVSVPVLVEAQCASRLPPETHALFGDLCPARADGTRAIADLSAFLEQLLGHAPASFDAGDAIAAELSHFVPEGRQTLRPTLVLRQDGGPPAALVWDVPEAIEDLDANETVTGPWEYPAAAKLDRLLRATKVPIGILTNRRVVRLIYAPHGESTGSITFRVDDMATVGGRPILDAFVMLLHARRFFVVAVEQSLPHLLAESRKRQANVTNELAEQVLDAIQILLRGFEVAAERDRSTLLSDAVQRGDDQVYGGLLTTLLRLVFVLYAEDWGLLPSSHRLWSQHYSLLALFDELQADAGRHPDSMSRRFGAWGRLVALFRVVFLGASHGDLHLPARRGHLFDPERFPFLEGWGPWGGAPIKDAAARAGVALPSVDDETVFRVLGKLILFQGQRLSYRSLDVEQLGSVYEALMGYHVVRLEHDAVSVRVKAKSGAARAWVEVAALLAEPPARRVAWLEDELGFDKANAKKVAAAVLPPKDSGDGDADPTTRLLDLAAGRSAETRARRRAPAGRLVLQPGPERRRTSSHYTPRELSGPIVRRTLEPLLAVMGEAPASERVLNLKICDPAMGSGAFLVEACRFLGDRVVEAWAREGSLPAGDPVLAARRLVAQRCLYGVDKNPWAVDLAKLSLWLVTLAKDLPFTFLDHALRHGDSLVGLDFDQIRAGHWKPGKQVELAELTLREALDEAIAIRQHILALASDPSPEAQREKERLTDDADDAVAHARLLADLVVGAFFAHDKDKAREKERRARVDAFTAWKQSGAPDVPEPLATWQREIRARLPVFHWMLELPEVFYAERPDPLDADQVNRAAFMDAFVGNPPFAGKNGITEANGEGYIEWLKAIHEGAHGAADLSAHFFRRAGVLLGRHGTIGLIATNTIAQGDTRETGLRALVAGGDVIYEAERSMLWPGDSAVAVAVVHLARGNATRAAPMRRLDGATVSAVDSRLRPNPERADPVRLASNADLSFQGSIVLGMGFVLTPAERDALVQKNPKNAERILPYLGGEEVNSNPDQGFERYVINFGQMTLEEAQKWPELLGIVREKVKPERERQKDAGGRATWWQFLRYRAELYEALAQLKRSLITSGIAKHRVFAFVGGHQIYTHNTYLFPLDSYSAFATLQSRVHTTWAALHSSGLEERLGYRPSDCFETFPFPRRDPRTVITELESIGQRVHSARQDFMLAEQIGLTVTYNRLKDGNDNDRRVKVLRELHLELDATVLAAFGWSDIDVPAFVTANGSAERKASEVFEETVVDRLFALNAERAAQERQEGLASRINGTRTTTREGRAAAPTHTVERARKQTRGINDGHG